MTFSANKLILACRQLNKLDEHERFHCYHVNMLNVLSLSLSDVVLFGI